MNQQIIIANDIPHLDERVRFYDARARLYDFVVGSRLYHHFAWGMSPAEHERFAWRALHESGEGPVLDGGCGSLLFTARSYLKVTRPLTLYDASRGMLERGRRRLEAQGTRLDHVRFVQGDLERLPFREASFSVVFHFGVLHCLDRPSRAIDEFHRALIPGGRLYLSCLVLGRSRGDQLLGRLARAGHIAKPRTRREVDRMLARSGFRIMRARSIGSFYFLEAMRVD